jgi:hypothetical protein
MKNIIVALLVAGLPFSVLAREAALVQKADQGLEQLSQKSKRDRIVRKLEKQLSPEKRAELINDIENSELPEKQKMAMTAVVEAIEDIE